MPDAGWVKQIQNVPGIYVLLGHFLFLSLLVTSSHRSGRADVTLGIIYDVEELEALSLELISFLKVIVSARFGIY